MSQSMKNFIGKYGTAADAAAEGSPIFPETILTAAALESGYAKSKLAADYNNFFGIKKQKGDGWTGKVVSFKTKEQDKKGNVYWVIAEFRHYETPEDSFKNYVRFIQGPRYVKAGVTTAKDPVEQFKKIHAAGYATDTKYSNLLTSIFNSVKEWSIRYPGAATTGGSLAVLGIIAAFFF